MPDSHALFPSLDPKPCSLLPSRYPSLNAMLRSPVKKQDQKRKRDLPMLSPMTLMWAMGADGVMDNVKM